MTDIDDNQLITMGMNLGVYTLAGLFAEGVIPNQKAWQILRDHCGNELEKQTGMPAEDLALKVQPVIDDMLKKVGGH